MLFLSVTGLTRKIQVVVFLNLAFISVLPVWGLPGLGLNSKEELFVAGAIYGFQQGAIQSFSRSLLGHLTPPSCEAEFFALFELTDKGTAWLGPLLLVFITEVTDNIRFGLIPVLVLIGAGALILVFVDTKQGGLDALAFFSHHELDDDRQEIEKRDDY